MAGVVLTLALSVILAGLFWLTFGSRFRFSADARQNDVLNFIAYGALVLPIVFAIVVYGIEKI